MRYLYCLLLTAAVLEGLCQTPGVTVHAVKYGKRQAPIVSITIDNIEPGEAGAILDQAFDIKVRTGLHCTPVAHKTLGTYPLGTVRLSPGYFNTMEEIEFAVKAIERIARAGSLQEQCTGLGHNRL